ncbi:C40 family peptidase [Patescibacteria group bacterium]|nr:C40 family peptidase [Patescibacteria group bacterium]
MKDLNNALEKYKKQNQQDYGIAVFDVDLKVTAEGIFIFGEVLTENQKNKIIELLKEKKIKFVNEKIKVLSDASKRYEIGWVVVKTKIADLKSRFVSSKIINEIILKRIRCSQVFQGEILRVLYKNEDQFLVQQNDLTIGWVNRSEVIVKKNNLLKEWKKGVYAIKGELIKIKNEKIEKKFHGRDGIVESSETCNFELVSESAVYFREDNNIKNKQQTSQPQFEIIKEVEKYLGTKYLLGGKTEKGIDCSGLVQRAYKNSLGIILPKHSWDQKEIGVKVLLEDVKTGDLVFLIKKSNQHKHVGIVEVISSCHSELVEPLQSNINLIHASLDEKKVVGQKLQNVLERYEFVEARRIVE